MHVLIVADQETIHVTLAIALGEMKHTVSIATDRTAALNALQRGHFDAVFLDAAMSQNKSPGLLDDILLISPRAAVILIAADASIEAAVEAMRRGAFDYVMRPHTREQLQQSLVKVERMRRLENRAPALEFRDAAEPSDFYLQTSCPAMQRVLAVAFKAARSDATILLLGESGAGKSQLARAIHQWSSRAGAPFVTVNCPSLSQDLLEDELFGHAKGAFTGAVTETWGKTAAADGGTLFFDEIGELAPEIQAKLLRLLQERDYERVGETISRRSNVRVIAATNRDLRQAVEDRAFREDLYYRLNVIALDIPPLRDRTEDFDRIVNAFLISFALQAGRPVKRLSAANRKKLRQYSWPGNLRELKNVIERAVILSNGDEIALPDFAELPRLPSRVGSGMPCTLEDIGNEHIRQVLAKTRSIKDAATILGIDPATLHRKLKKIRASESISRGKAIASGTVARSNGSRLPHVLYNDPSHKAN